MSRVQSYRTCSRASYVKESVRICISSGGLSCLATNDDGLKSARVILTRPDTLTQSLERGLSQPARGRADLPGSRKQIRESPCYQGEGAETSRALTCPRAHIVRYAGLQSCRLLARLSTRARALKRAAMSTC
eukprot:3219820-Pleurochrysis_carterae.AAC.1